MQPVFDLHGPLVEDEHRTCRDDKQDRDKLQTKFENMKYKGSLQNTKYVLHNAKFKYKNASSLWRKKQGREIVNKFQMVILQDMRCAKDQNKTKHNFFGPLHPSQVRGMLNQLLLGPRGKSISNEGESTEIGCQEYKITIWVGYLDKKGPWCYLRGRGR